jgi:hypothetical protein
MTNKLPTGVDGRSALARAYRRACRDLAAEFGGESNLTFGERLLIEQSALLSVQATALRGDVLQGRVIDSTEITRLANSSARLIQAVSAQRSKRKPAFVPIRERLKS